MQVVLQNHKYRAPVIVVDSLVNAFLCILLGSEHLIALFNFFISYLDIACHRNIDDGVFSIVYLDNIKKIIDMEWVFTSDTKKSKI